MGRRTGKVRPIICRVGAALLGGLSLLAVMNAEFYKWQGGSSNLAVGSRLWDYGFSALFGAVFLLVGVAIGLCIYAGARHLFSRDVLADFAERTEGAIYLFFGLVLWGISWLAIHVAVGMLATG